MWSLLFRSWNHQALLPFLAPSPHHGRITESFRYLESKSEILRDGNIYKTTKSNLEEVVEIIGKALFLRVWRTCLGSHTVRIQIYWVSALGPFSDTTFFSYLLPLFLLITHLSIPSNLSLPNSSFPSSPHSLIFLFLPLAPWAPTHWAVLSAEQREGVKVREEWRIARRNIKTSSWGTQKERKRQKYRDWDTE